MRILAIVFFIVLLCIGLYIKTNPYEYRNKSLCEMFEKFKARSFHGVITKKYEDIDHHLNKTFEVESQKIVIDFDRTGFYEFIKVNDSVIKESGSPVITVFRQGEMLKEFQIDFGCKE